MTTPSQNTRSQDVRPGDSILYRMPPPAIDADGEPASQNWPARVTAVHYDGSVDLYVMAEVDGEQVSFGPVAHVPYDEEERPFSWAWD